MNGTTIQLFPKRTFTFTDVSGAGTVETTVLKAVDVSQYTEGTLLVRVHSASIGASATVDVALRTTAPTPEDPSNEFVSSSDAGSVQLTSSTSAPVLLTGSLSSNFGGMLTVLVRGNQPASAQSISVDISAELSLKS